MTTTKKINHNVKSKEQHVHINVTTKSNLYAEKLLVF